MRLVPIVYVTNMEKLLAFYEALSKNSTPKFERLTLLVNGLGTSSMALHIIEDLPKNRFAGLALSFACEEKLEKLVERLETNHIELHQNISDEAFGRSLQLKDPDGLIIQVNEHDPDLYA